MKAVVRLGTMESKSFEVEFTKHKNKCSWNHSGKDWKLRIHIIKLKQNCNGYNSTPKRDPLHCVWYTSPISEINICNVHLVCRSNPLNSAPLWWLAVCGVSSIQKKNIVVFFMIDYIKDLEIVLPEKKKGKFRKYSLYIYFG